MSTPRTGSVGSTGEAGNTGGIFTILLCLLVALLEGLDLQAPSIAGLRMAQIFSFSPGKLGFVFGASAVGLLPGAAIGGWLADLFGRKRVLITSVLLFGLFSLATTQVWDYASLLAARFLTGLGLGAAMPNLIALCTEAVVSRRSSAVGLMYCGMPFGAALGALIGTAHTDLAGWRDIFYVGGLGPVAIALALTFFLRESRQFARRSPRARASPGSSSTHPAGNAPHRGTGVAFALWGEGRVIVTFALWISYLGTLMVLNFLMNWLQPMMSLHGLKPKEAGFVLMLFNVGAGFGAIVIASLMDRLNPRVTVPGMYVGMVVALVVLGKVVGGMTVGVAATQWASFACGFFIVGGQSALYALAGHAYPTVVRGTGVGAVVAVGRLGTFLGPMLAGELFSLGKGVSMLIMSSIPLIVAAALCAWLVSGRLVPETVAAKKDVGANRAN